jgi:hypothetical protein
MKVLKVISLIALALSCSVGLFGQENISEAVLEKRKGADIGSKPCRYDKVERPCVLINSERLSSVRNDILQKRSERKTVYEKSVKADADLWLHRPVVIPGRGGWFHDFFCTDGARLEIPNDKTFHDDVPSVCPVCGKTYLNDKVLAVRRALVHYWLCGAVRNLSLVYAVEGKKEYAEKAIEILMKYADAYPRQTILQQTLEEAVVIIPLAEGYDLLYDAMTEEQRSHIQQDLLWPAGQMLAKSGVGGNWGSWHLSAVGVIGYATRHQRFIDYATEQFKAQISDQLGEDGLWPESVHTYHFYPLNGFLSFVEAATNNGDDLYNLEIKQGKGIKKMLTSALRYAYPDTRLAAINDGWYESYLPQDQYTVGYYRYGLPEFAWSVKEIRNRNKGRNSGELLNMDYREALYGEKFPKHLSQPVFTSIDFPVLGIAILRQGSDVSAEKEMMMTFDYGPYLGHGHPDKMNFTLFAKGKVLIPDYGTTGYASATNKFLQSTSAHNTIVIDGKNHPATKDRNLTCFEVTPSFKIATATTSQVDTDCIWTRSVMMTDSYAVVWDHIDGTKKHRYDWFFHAEGDALSLDGGNTLSIAEKEFSYPFITNVQKQGISGNPGLATWNLDDCGVKIWFMNTGNEQSVYTSSMPTGEGGRQIPLLVLRKESEQADFLAVVKPVKGKKEKSERNEVGFSHEANGDIHITVTCGKTKDRIILNQKNVTYEKNGERPVVILNTNNQIK